jgi:septum site-determining protein MinC
MRERPKPNRILEFKSASLSVITTLVRDADPARLGEAMHAVLGGASDFFSGDATVIDFSQIEAPPPEIDWRALLALLRRYHLQPLAVRDLAEPLAEGARQAGLAVLRADERPAQRASATAAPPPQPAAARAHTLVIDRNVRSGQQVYARDGDVVVLGNISNGAEVIADGHIHCYGVLRGRALAGARGDTAARIFTTCMSAELVSIAGLYRTFENGAPENVSGRPAQVSLSGEGERQQLLIVPLVIG